MRATQTRQHDLGELRAVGPLAEVEAGGLPFGIRPTSAHCPSSDDRSPGDRMAVHHGDYISRAVIMVTLDILCALDPEHGYAVMRLRGPGCEELPYRRLCLC